MIYKTDTRLTTILQNVYAHLQRDYDCLWVIVGDTGTGKSMLAMQVLETWYKLILKQEFPKTRVKQITGDYIQWLENFGKLTTYDMNIYDEGATTLDSKEFMTRISKDINKLFNVFRAKRFFTIIVIPSWFNLNKNIREQKVRGLLYTYKRGKYLFFTKKDIKFLNAYNDRRILKSMDVTRPSHQYSFPDYKGELLEAYKAAKFQNIDKIVADVISDHKASDATGKLSYYDMFKDKVIENMQRDKPLSNRALGRQLGISYMTISDIIKRIHSEGEFET